MSEKSEQTSDVVVVGAGPAGMSAALALNAAGASVTVVDEQSAVGGQIYREIDRNQQAHDEVLEILGKDYAQGAALTQRFHAANIDICYQSSVWDIEAADPENGGAARLGLVSPSGTTMLHPQHIVLACGAMERPTPFPGWTLPGVMTVGAAQTLLKDARLLPEGRVVVAGNGPLLSLFTHQLLAAGIKPERVLNTGNSVWSAAVPLLPQAVMAGLNSPAPLWKGLGWLRELRRAGIVQTNAITALKAQGEERLRSVSYRANGQNHEIEADLLLVHDGVIPNSHLAIAAECEHVWQETQHYWTPVLDQQGGSSQAGISIVGDAAGINGADVAALNGQCVGWAVAQQLGLVNARQRDEATQDAQRQLAKLSHLRRFLDQLYPPSACFQQLADETLICRCEEVTAGELREVAALGCMGPNQGKAFTRCGMGPCMGRLCGNTVSQLLADYHGRPVQEIGHYRIRPPVKPLTLGELVGME